ncbi:TIGR03943 family putative permease subunit [Frigoriglobus tundricola]|uniref:DUF1980 domain-containing protein n=1 Tax=Frigoriglobus tundricola TaxID=2774151 RepID=A0A6M5Z3U5_9BACT|nr:hypothetical protein [Frigoriglobus tundricola]QJX00395.1 hypothetical protein FTUN_8024 [Frigoriglobus tundricola]
MAHSHSGCQSPRDYFTEQLLTILVCGALAFVGIQMYMQDMLRHILAPQFHFPVLIGSIAVLVLVAFRAIAVWREAGELQPLNDMNCQENHVHSATCNHLPGLPDGSGGDPNLADDGHSHDMSWMFARMLILVFPIALFALGVPNTGFSKGKQLDAAGKDTALNMSPKAIEEAAKDTTTVEIKPLEVQPDGTKVRELKTAKGLKIREIVSTSGDTKYVLIPGEGAEFSFNALTEAAFDADKRKALEGQTAIMQGRFKRLGDKEFTLFRLKMTCCGPDAVTLKVRIIAPQAVGEFADFDWVQVKGVIQFIKAPGQERYTPVLVLSDITDITRQPIKNEYEF